MLLFFVGKRQVPFRWMFVMFGAFIVSCGFTHFMEVVTLYEPVYRVSGLVKLATAIVSWATVIGLVPLVPKALALRSPEELEREVAARTAELARANELLLQEVSRREQAQADAEKANRAKDEFLATVSHELRTPLNAMLGWAHLLKSGQLDAERFARGLEVLERNTKAQARLIDDLLDVSRIISGKMVLEARALDLAAVVEAAADTVRPAAAAKGVALEIDGTPTPVLGDAARLQQVVWNLLANAVKFTPSGGRVEAAVHALSGEAELTVRDNGAGIAADILPCLFERFRQGEGGTTRRHGGLGLGLAIARDLVELHGGAIEAHSDGEGKGAIFRVRLPAREGRGEAT